MCRSPPKAPALSELNIRAQLRNSQTMSATEKRVTRDSYFWLASRHFRWKNNRSTPARLLTSIAAHSDPRQCLTSFDLVKYFEMGTHPSGYVMLVSPLPGDSRSELPLFNNEPRGISY